MKLLNLSLLLVFSTITVFSQNWQLAWSDEFDSSLIDLTSWTHETGGNGWGNNELEYYTNRNVNSYIEDGKLIIKAQQESYGGRSYTSARLKTQGKRFWLYGKIEARMKLPYGQGIWPAFWMLGENIPSAGWPACGEIDIMEMIGGQNRENTVHGTAHWDNSGQHAQYGGDYSLSSGTFADDFHVFTIEWDKSLIKWYVDNSRYTTIDITPAGLSEFHQEFFIVLNLAVGGNWPGNPNSSTTFPQYLEVDYLRVYQQNPTEIKDENGIISEFKLEQNYPNPFNPATKIKYSIPHAVSPFTKGGKEGGFVTLKIYDMLGNEAAVIVNEEQSAGEYEIDFNSGIFGLSSGMYFYKLTAGNYFDIKKMILMK
jgi:beta-glucanase (GH16 family)